MLPAIHGGLMAQRLEPRDTVYVPERLVLHDLAPVHQRHNADNLAVRDVDGGARNSGKQRSIGQRDEVRAHSRSRDVRGTIRRRAEGMGGGVRG